jgi:hypothetical protein
MISHMTVGLMSSISEIFSFSIMKCLSSQPLMMEARNASDLLDIYSIFVQSVAQDFIAYDICLKTKLKFALYEQNEPVVLS